MLDNDELDQKMEQMFLISGAMFAISTNYLVSSSLLRHPKEFSKMVMGDNNRSAASFRKLGNVKRMKNYVLYPFKEDIAENLPRKASRSVTRAFGHSHPNRSLSPSRSQNRKTTK